MFFIISKILYFLIQPINWVVALMLYALFAKKPVRKRRSLTAAIVLTFFFCNHFIVNEVYKWWEVETLTAEQLQQPYDIGILLGGYSNSHIQPSHDRQNFSIRANRFMNAYELYRTGKVKKLLLTGGSGDLLQNQPSEAEEMKGFMLRIGIPAKDIIVEGKSRNTYENAVFTKKILDERYPSASCLLLTSASHMRRSMGCFRKAGVNFTPFSVDFLSEKTHWRMGNIIVPDRLGFYWWEVLIKEWIGYLAYWVRGYV
jgi:uncharacterized SAM-binding protein YcdF (DUF218 family)